MAAFGEGVREALDKLREESAASQAADVAKQGVVGATRLARAAGTAVTGSISRGVGAVTLQGHREETQAVLAEIVEVLSAHEAEIAALRERLDHVEAERRLG